MSSAHGHARSSSLLVRSLVSNAAFSGLSGLALLLGAGPLGSWTGVSEIWLLRAIGVGLVGFCAALILLARSEPPDRRLVLAATGADFAWVLGSAALLVGFPDLLTTAGKSAVGIVAALVAAFGVAQVVGLRRLTRTA